MAKQIATDRIVTREELNRMLWEPPIFFAAPWTRAFQESHPCLDVSQAT